ncbi:putative pyrimidine 5' nucleotidase [Candida maltosa Xu316]|uniref:Putative pyrimidine 5' nucleotidase n=1 Tax=Candida maltosa (strain Xu316) TaxID=1245528 RepID=M3HGY8_CANMX|nr:putative pyrimidine 5' nucleotidase [Candida maltosa Xu316]
MTVSNNQTVTYINPELTEAENAKPGRHVNLRFGYGPIPPHDANKKIFFFDIDNCLYPRSTKINDMMQVKIHDYFRKSLQLDDEEAHELHMNYYKTYGLAIEGLVRNHQVDALDYNSKVDDALDLHSVLRYDQTLRNTLTTIKESNKFDYFWLITNAYKNHALRVVSFLGIGDLFDGLTFCDYAKYPIICKPMKEYFHNCFALTQLDFHNKEVMGKQYFIDDSELNVKAAFNLGVGHVFHYVEWQSDIENLKKKPDFEQYYGKGDNSDPHKIFIVSDFSDLPKLVGCS